MESTLNKIARIVVFGFCPFGIFLLWLEDTIQGILVLFTSYQRVYGTENLIIDILFGALYFFAFLSLIINVRNIFKTEKVDVRLLRISNRILFFDFALLVSVLLLLSTTNLDTFVPLFVLTILSPFLIILVIFYNYLKYKTGGKSLIVGLVFLLVIFFICFQIWLTGMGI